MRLMKTIAILALLLFSSSSNAEVLYKVSYGEQTWWLLGTIHIGEPGMELSKKSQEAFAASEEIWFELTPEELDKAGLLLFQQGASATTLSSQVDQELWQRVQNTLAEYGIEAIMFNNLEPWLMEVMVSMQLALGQGFSIEYGSEMQLLNWLEAEPRPIYGFETAQDQIDSLKASNYRTVTEALEHLLETITREELDVGNLAALWQAGELAELMQLIRESMSAEQLDALLWQRNLAWFEMIQSMLNEADKTVRFIAVGAGHLGDELGLLQLFSDQGAQIKNYSTGAH